MLYDPLNILEEEWTFKFFWPWTVPVGAIRNYFGEKIALYFDFLSYYCSQLSYMGIIGLPVFVIHLIADEKQDNFCENIPKGKDCPYEKGTEFVILTIAFSLVVTIWSTVFVETWRR